MTTPDRRALVEQLQASFPQLLNHQDVQFVVVPAKSLRAAIAALSASVSTAQVQALVEQWRGFAERTSAVEANLPDALMAETKARMRGLRDQANECADDLARLIAEPQTDEGTR